ncbi:MAG: hypothetical protein HY059_17450 [Proteobacteria bacterium]|nr:hypothetical protein [Pseudomonadota bacterium]
MYRVLVVLVIVIVAGFSAWAAPPSDGDGRFAEWFRSLKHPDGYGCCDISDCRQVEYRRGRTGYEALVTPATHPTDTPQWVEIPAERIIQRDNPTGRAVLCWLPSRGVMCFVRPVET